MDIRELLNTGAILARLTMAGQIVAMLCMLM